MTGRAAIALLLVLAGARPLPGQFPSIRGYYLNVGMWSDSTPFSLGGLGDVNRLRFMFQPSLGPVHLEVAYEHVFTYNQRRALESRQGLAVEGGGEWARLEWDLEESDHVMWRHRFDRLSARWAPDDRLEITAGRQTVSWATTLLLSPADPFIPFDPSDPFREYRAGVDALRLQIFPSQLSDLDIVVRPAKVRAGVVVVDETMTVLGRGRGVWQGWELSGWLGVLHDQPAAAVGAAGGVGQVAVRCELSVREKNDEVVGRGAVGVDSRLDLFDRDFYFSIEYQHDGLGASEAADLTRVRSSEAFARGELQTLSRDVAATQLSYQVHPLWNADLLVLWSIGDQSTLISAGASYSASNEVTLRAGLFVGLGDDTTSGANAIPSEYGITPTLLYLSASLFF